jgi:hypothetical protein
MLPTTFASGHLVLVVVNEVVKVDEIKVAVAVVVVLSVEV